MLNLTVAQPAPPPPEDEGGPAKRGATSRVNRPPQEETVPADLDMDKVTDFLKEVDPRLLERLKYLKEDNPAEFSRILSRVWHEMKMLERLKRENPEQYEAVLRIRKVEAKVKMLAEDYRKSEDPKQKETLKKELKSALAQLFDLKMAQHEKEVKKLEEQLKKQREKLENQKKEKDKLVEERLQKMTGEKEEWDW